MFKGKKKKPETKNDDSRLQETKEKSIESKEDQKRKEFQEESWKERFLRVSADFQNFKRRVEKEKLEWIKIAQIDVIKTFLSLIDEFDRAIKSSEKFELEKEAESWLEGFKIIRKNLDKKMDNLGVSEIDCSKEFDPHFHEALMQISSKDHKSGEIVEVISTGYLFEGGVIRHAKVSVAK